MEFKCPKCNRAVPEDSVYCPYCGYGIRPSAKTGQLSTGGTLMIVASVVSLVFLILCVKALMEIYSWYPPEIAQVWISYDQMFTIFSSTDFLFGFSSGVLSLFRRSYVWTMVFALLCTLSGAGAWIVSMILPFANLWQSFFYYFLPLFAIPVIGTALIYPRKEEFKH